MLKSKRRLYHGCSTVYKDGTRMLIGKGQDCVLSILFGNYLKTSTQKYKQDNASKKKSRFAKIHT